MSPPAPHLSQTLHSISKPLSCKNFVEGLHHALGPPEKAAILSGAKGIENRPKPWSWRGWMLLHAGQRIDRPALRVPLIARTIRGRELTT